MVRPSLFLGVAAVLVLVAGGDALACGDKFLVSGRGTRYQRPKSARAASVLIYANPASELLHAAGKLSLESLLKREGHRSTTVGTLEQLAALVAGGRFDVVLAATSVGEAVTDLVGGAPDAPVVVAFKTPVKEGSLLQAVDKAVAQRDKRHPEIRVQR